MTIDETIKHYEEVMMENLEKTKDKNASDPIAISCGECADNHRQLAEWLKELKAHREAWEKVKNDIQKSADMIQNADIISGYMISMLTIDKYRPKEGDTECPEKKR